MKKYKSHLGEENCGCEACIGERMEFKCNLCDRARIERFSCKECKKTICGDCCYLISPLVNSFFVICKDCYSKKYKCVNCGHTLIDHGVDGMKKCTYKSPTKGKCKCIAYAEITLSK